MNTSPAMPAEAATPAPSDAQILLQCCLGNVAAARFLEAWRQYVHLIDDIVDGEAPAAAVIQVGRWANELYANPFYLAHVRELQPLVQLVTCCYEDSVEWERSEVPWQRVEADTVRHCGADMVRVVAYLVGGYSHMRVVSMAQRRVCYHDHHDEQGQPI